MVSIMVTNVNIPPQLACNSTEAGLFDSEWLIDKLQALGSRTYEFDAVDLGLIEAEVVEQRDTASVASGGRSNIRVETLTHISSLIQDELLISSSSAFDLACSSRKSWDLPMSTRAAPSWLNVSILAYDPTEAEAITYEVVSLPAWGSLYGTSTLPATSYGHSNERTYLQIGGAFYEVSAMMPSPSMPGCKRRRVLSLCRHVACSSTRSSPGHARRITRIMRTMLCVFFFAGWPSRRGAPLSECHSDGAAAVHPVPAPASHQRPSGRQLPVDGH